MNKRVLLTTCEHYGILVSPYMKHTRTTQRKTDEGDNKLVNLSARIPRLDRQTWRAEALRRGMSMQEAAWQALKEFLGDPEVLRRPRQ